jgi:flagellar biosynthetic protein FliP
MPAFLISELKTAFLIGFQIFLPFLMVDLLVASVVVAMGLSTLSPTVISFPFKLLLFVLLDGWRLVVELLMASFGTLG